MQVYDKCECLLEMNWCLMVMWTKAVATMYLTIARPSSFQTNWHQKDWRVPHPSVLKVCQAKIEAPPGLTCQFLLHSLQPATVFQTGDYLHLWRGTTPVCQMMDIITHSGVSVDLQPPQLLHLVPTHLALHHRMMRKGDKHVVKLVRLGDLVK